MVRDDILWKGCCGKTIDRRASVFFTQVAIGVMVLLYAMVEWSKSPPHECSGTDPTPYISMITFILGWFAPAPTIVSHGPAHP